MQDTPKSKGDGTSGKDGVKFKVEVKDKDSVMVDKRKEGEGLNEQGQDEEEGEGDEEQRENEEEQEEDTNIESNEGKTTENEPKDGAKKKIHTRMKNKMKYQMKKNQLPMKSTDNKTPVSQNADNDDQEDSKDKKEHEMEKKSEQNRTLTSHTSKEKDAANMGATQSDGNNGTNKNGSGQPSSMENSQHTAKNQPGNFFSPVQPEDKDEKVSF